MEFFIIWKTIQNQLTKEQMFDTITLNKNTKVGDDSIEQFTSRGI